MLFSVAWLADFVDLSEFWSGRLHPEDRAGIARLGDRLTALGLAVEGTPTHSPSDASDPSSEPIPLLDVEVTTNRPDAMCHFGLARELAVALGQSLRAPRAALRESSERASAHVRVELADPAACPRYATRIIRGVKIGPSPDWLQERLRSIGLRPISNVVDITNYVLWETGQPLHAFDLAKIAGPAGAPKLIQVRRARAKALRRSTASAQARSHDSGDRGRSASDRAWRHHGRCRHEVTARTTDVLLGAHFDRRWCEWRQGARHTPTITVSSAARTLRMLVRDAARGGADRRDRWRRSARDPVEAVSTEYLAEAASGILDFHRLNRFVGAAILSEEARRILAGLDSGSRPWPTNCG